MAVDSTQLLRTSFLTSDVCHETLSEDKLFGSKRVHLHLFSAAGICAKVPSPLNSAVAITTAVCNGTDAPQARRGNAGSYKVAAREGLAPTIQHGEVIVETNSTSASRKQAYHVAGDSWTSLQRFILETQWTCTTGDPSQPDLSSSDRMPDGEHASQAVSSGRPSARHRRIQARRRSLHLTNTTIPAVRTFQTSRGRLSESLGTLECVSTSIQVKDRSKRELLTAEQEIQLAKKMRVGQNLKAAKKKLAERLGCEPTDEQWAFSLEMTPWDLHAKLLQADRARDKMFMANLKMLVSIAKRYSNCSIDIADLIQEGAVGLLRGLEKFNHKKGFRLSTYTHWWIRQGVTRAIAEKSRSVRVPVYIHERLSLIREAKVKLKVEDGTASIKDISEILHMSVIKVSNALRATQKMASLEKLRGGSITDSLSEYFYHCTADSTVQSNPWAVVEAMLMKEDIDRLLALTLDPREQKIIRLYYGLDRGDGQSLPFKNIGQKIGLSKERVRQVESIARRKLQLLRHSINFDVLHL